MCWIQRCSLCLEHLHPPPARHVTWFLTCDESVRTVEIMCSSMWWEERVDDTALGLIQFCCQWHADIIKPRIFLCQVHLAAHFLISATALLTTVIYNDCQKTKQISLFRRCFSYLVFETSTLSKHWQFPKQVLCFKGFVLFGFFVLVTHGIGIVDWQSSIEQKLSSKLSSITPT